MKREILIGLILSFWLLALPASGQQDLKTHTVQRGETFGSIAAKYGMTESELRAANPNAKTCFAGMKLAIIRLEVPNTIKSNEKVTSQQRVNEGQNSSSIEETNRIHTSSLGINKRFEEGKEYFYKRKWRKAISSFKKVIADQNSSDEERRQSEELLTMAMSEKEARTERRIAFFNTLGNLMENVSNLLEGDSGETGSSTIETNSRGKTSNSSVSGLEKHLYVLNDQYERLMEQYNASLLMTNATVSARENAYKKSVNRNKNSGRLTTQPVRAGQGLPGNLQGAMAARNAVKSAKQKGQKEREPIAKDIANVLRQMIPLDQTIYKAKVQYQVYETDEQRLEDAIRIKDEMSSWNSHLFKLGFQMDGVHTAKMVHDMNDEIRRLQGWSEDEIAAFNKQAADFADETRQAAKNARDKIKKSGYELKSMRTLKLYNDYDFEIQRIHDNKTPYDKMTAKEKIKKLKEYQQLMHPIRQNYKNAMDKDIPDPSDLENWNPKEDFWDRYY